MFPALEKTIEEFEKSAALSNKLGDAVEQFTTARIAIRDYVISRDETSYSKVEKKVAHTLETLAIAMELLGSNAPAAILQGLQISIQEWKAIAQNVRDAFASHQKFSQTYMIEGFPNLLRAENTLLSLHKLTPEFILAIHNLNAKASNSLIENNESLIEEVKNLLVLIKESLSVERSQSRHWRESKDSFLSTLKAYGNSLEELWASRKTANDLLHNSLAPLGSKIQSELEAFKAQIVALQLKNGELKKAYLTLEQISLTDPLTGLWNRRFLAQHMDADAAKAIRKYDDWIKSTDINVINNEDLVFFLVDLDHFKQVNDQYGHTSGDLVLVQIQQRLKKVFRESDYLVRWGGEEFLVVARGANREEAEIMAERTCAAVRSVPFEIEHGVLLEKTCSIGFACFPFLPTSPHLLTWNQVVELADEALYMAKNSGRNGWVGLFASDNTGPEQLLRRVDSAIMEALRNGEMQLKTSLKRMLEPIEDRK